MVYLKTKPHKGFSLVEVLVVAAIMLVVFGGLLISFRYSLQLISHSRAKLTALTLANDGMEYVRSLSYNAIGTVAGIPAGLIPQVSTTTLNGIEFTKTVLIEYIDDDADGLGGADSNGITTDYKQVKITLSWTLRGDTSEVFFVSNIIPRSIETSVGGGTLRVNVFDADVNPLPGASVRLVNTSLLPAIDITRTTDSAGVALFGGAPAGANYEIIVTAANYSTDKTYVATTSLPNPFTLPVAVLEADISTMNFFIDELSDLSLSVLGSREEEQFVETFSNAAALASTSGLSVVGGHLELAGSSGSYVASGFAYTNPFVPATIDQWDYLVIDGVIPNTTDIKVRFYTGTSTYSVIPDTDLPGNSAGFTVGSAALSNLDATVYPEIVAGIEMTTASNINTPTLDSLVIGYVESKTVRGGLPLVINGSKTIGTEADFLTPVSKNKLTVTTDAQGEVALDNLEWDSYAITNAGYDTAMVCPYDVLAVKPGVTTPVEILLVTNTANTLRVVVTNSAGQPIIGAVVELSRPGFSELVTTSVCGQVFFNGLAAEADYVLDISAVGYTARVLTDVNIASDSVQVIAL